MKLRFLADCDFKRPIAAGLVRREPSIDLRSGREAALQGVPDSEVLERAAAEGRALLTHDQRTMPFHFGEFISRKPSPGAFIVPQRMEIGAAIEELLLIWSASESDDWINRILYLPL